MTFSIVRWLDATGPEVVMHRIELEWSTITQGVPGVPSFEIQKQGPVAPGKGTRNAVAARIYCIPGFEERVLEAFRARLAQLGLAGVELRLASPN